MPSSSFGNPFASDVSVHSVTRPLRRTRDIACSVQKRLAIAAKVHRFAATFFVTLACPRSHLLRGLRVCQPTGLPTTIPRFLLSTIISLQGLWLVNRYLHLGFGDLSTKVCVQGCSGFGFANQHNKFDRVESLPPNIPKFAARHNCHHLLLLGFGLCRPRSSFRVEVVPASSSKVFGMPANISF